MKKRNLISTALTTLTIFGSLTAPTFADQVTLTQKTNYYNKPNDTKAAGTLAPQTVNIVGKEGWYKIETDIGDKWIRIPFQSYTMKIYEKINYYDKINDSKSAGALSAPQTITVIGEKDGWYKIRTYNGDKWIKAPFRARAHQINTKTNVFYKPNVPNALPAGTLQQGDIVTIIGYSNGWYKIKTQDNKFLWMKRQVPNNEDNTFEGTIEIENGDIYQIKNMIKVN